jgi:hypothetical protein
MQLFVRRYRTMIAAPVQRDVDGIPNEVALRESSADGLVQQGCPSSRRRAQVRTSPRMVFSGLTNVFAFQVHLVIRLREPSERLVVGLLEQLRR